MKTNVIVFAILIAILSLYSCQKENILLSPEFIYADEALWTHFEQFEAEASLRGLQYDLNQLRISGVIQDIKDEGVAGSCQYGSHIDNHVTIDRDFWNRSSYNLREFVVFHELGHCVLLRDHNESQDGQGRCLSIMRSGLTNCRDTYNAQTRSSFIDELFHQN